MNVIRGNAETVWIKYCEAIIKRGRNFFDEDEKIKELLDVYLIFEEFDEKNKIYNKFADSRLIELYREKMVSTEIIPELNSSYGKRLYDQMGINQVKWLVDRLRKKPETKAATISLLLPNDPGPRIPCLSLIDIKIRDNKLNLIGFFRSQNAARGYGNFIGVRDLHKKIAKELNYPLGEMKFFVSSAHIYEKDFLYVYDMIRESKDSLSKN